MMAMPDQVTVVGGGVFGLWQALTLCRAGAKVRLIERTTALFSDATSRYAGAMLAPHCEAEAGPPELIDLGLAGLQLWRAALPGHVIDNGTLVVAPARDRADLLRFGKMTSGHAKLYAQAIGGLEPDLAGRFPAALMFASEAHMDPRSALPALADLVTQAGCDIELGRAWDGHTPANCDVLVDCRGLAARDSIPTLRGVRGERAIVRARDVTLSRVVRLLHPRQPIYIVPWADKQFMIGATVIESDDPGPVTVRSVLELLGAAYAVHPAFADAEILDLAAGVRPALPDNLPHISVDGRIVRVNGAYRHGYLLAPVMAAAVADYLRSGTRHPCLMRDTLEADAVAEH